MNIFNRYYFIFPGCILIQLAACSQCYIVQLEYWAKILEKTEFLRYY